MTNACLCLTDDVIDMSSSCIVLCADTRELGHPVTACTCPRMHLSECLCFQANTQSVWPSHGDIPVWSSSVNYCAASSLQADLCHTVMATLLAPQEADSRASHKHQADVLVFCHLFRETLQSRASECRSMQAGLDYDVAHDPSAQEAAGQRLSQTQVQAQPPQAAAGQLASGQAAQVALMLQRLPRPPAPVAATSHEGLLVAAGVHASSMHAQRRTTATASLQSSTVRNVEPMLNASGTGIWNATEDARTAAAEAGQQRAAVEPTRSHVEFAAA